MNHSTFRIALATAGIVSMLAALTACSTTTKRTGAAPETTAAPAATAPKVLTVPELERMAEQGTAIGVIMGKIDSSGTIYRLDTQQAKDLRASGFPASLMSYLQERYDYAIKQNPDLAKSDEKWTKIDDYWYGGLPYGWPREWVVGGPRFGEAFR